MTDGTGPGRPSGDLPQYGRPGAAGLCADAGAGPVREAGVRRSGRPLPARAAGALLPDARVATAGRQARQCGREAPEHVIMRAQSQRKFPPAARTDSAIWVAMNLLPPSEQDTLPVQGQLLATQLAFATRPTPITEGDQ